MIGKILSYIKNALRPAIFFLPITNYLFLYCLGFLIAANLLDQYQKNWTDNYAAVFVLLVKSAYWFTIILISFAFLTTAISFFTFWILKKRNKLHFSISIKKTGEDERVLPVIEVFISPILKPLLGFLKIRFQYDENHYSPKYTLVEKQRKLISFRYSGRFLWEMEKIREYELQEGYLYFEDFFQFFSFTSSLKMTDSVVIRPKKTLIQHIPAFPNKTEDTSVRIPELKKVEGEMLHFKSFENTDDLRRIVWKIYAKNKELVIRRPEILDPSASHVYVAASFYSSFSVRNNSWAEDFFLDQFKNIIWSIFKQVEKSGFKTAYITDQQTPKKRPADEGDEVAYKILSSEWQNKTKAEDIPHLSETSLLIISSLNDVDSIRTILENKPKGPTIVMVKLSVSLKVSKADYLFKRIFIEPEKGRLEKYKQSWDFSTFKTKVIENEKALEKLLHEYDQIIL